MLTRFRNIYATLSQKKWLKVGCFIFLLSLPVVLYAWHFAIVNRRSVFAAADWDEFSQMYEAARISILKYHQFPWWNPWSVGGEPLFGNPQFGLFSIPMALVLLFGTVVGLHLTVMVYFILGFWGMYLLLEKLGTRSRIISALLSYIWTFSGFATLHMIGGHLTFSVYLLAPWAFLTLLNIERRFGWLWFALVISLMIHTAPHYMSVETVLICLPLLFVKATRTLKASPHAKTKQVLIALKPYIFAAGLILLLTGVKLIYTFQFLHQYPRLTPVDPPESLKLFIASLTFRHPANPTTLSNTAYGWVEYGNYIGVITLGLFSYFVIRKLEKLRSFTLREWALLVSIFLAGLISLGSFAKLSPFNILHHFPLFDQMRVPSRFICWLTFGIIIFLAKLPAKKIIYIFLAISALDVFGANYTLLNSGAQPAYIAPSHPSRQFEQYEFYKADPALGQIGILSLQNLRLLQATQNNYGEIYAYEPVLNIGEYYYLPGTKRCGVNKSCHFVLTNNARVIEWSPHKIIIQRTASGPIKLNMNPGKVWKVNGKSVFANYRILELGQDFVINDTSKKIVVKYSPSL
jgi:hypothetical protein